MAYTALHNEYGNLTGTTSPIDYGSGLSHAIYNPCVHFFYIYSSGIEWIDGLLRQYNHTAIQVGLWLINQCTNVHWGIYDEIIRDFANFIKSKRSFFYIRIGYEFDSDLNHYDATEYKLAFRHIVNVFRSLNVSNSAFVWHSSGEKPRNFMV